MLHIASLMFKNFQLKFFRIAYVILLWLVHLYPNFWMGCQIEKFKTANEMTSMVSHITPSTHQQEVKIFVDLCHNERETHSQQ